METRHESFHRDGQDLDQLTDLTTGARVTVSRLGAELVSLARRLPGAPGEPPERWQGFLYRDGDLSPAPAGWSNHATVMGYYLHRLKGEKSLYRGQEIRGGNHGFLRRLTFRAPEVSAGDGHPARLVYAVDPGDYAASDYPLRVSLRLTYALEPGGVLRVGFRFDNREPDLSAHVSFGVHPGFALASPERGEVRLPAGRYGRYLAPGNFLSGEIVPVDHPGGPMPFRREDLPGSFLLDLAGVPARTFVVADPAGGRRTTLDLSAAPYVTLWSDGGPFVCVEPCWGLPDHAQPRPFEQKLGIQEIAPGGSLERAFTVRAELTPDP